jgi:uncharacterized protein YukE
VSDAEYPALGFDPLPGNPEAVRALAGNARIFGQRMTEQADALDTVRNRSDWTGDAADAFTEKLEHLPRRLREAGESVTRLARHLDAYADRYDEAKLCTWPLEEKAEAVRAALTTAQAAYGQPVIRAPGEPWCPPDRSAIDGASEELGVILREAHSFREHFETSVADLAKAIHDLADDAPNPPHDDDLFGWAKKLFELTPVGQAIDAAHRLLNDYPHFFSELAEVLTAVSAAAAFLAIPAVVVPGVGQVLGVVALATSAGAAAIDTSLYAGHATDENGRPYVTGGHLAMAWAAVGFAAGGVAMAAEATVTRHAAQDVQTTLGKEVGKQFAKETFHEAGRGLRTLGDLTEELGAKGATKWMGHITTKEFQSMGTHEKTWIAGGAFAEAVGPPAAANDAWNVFGLKDMAKITRVVALPNAVLEDLGTEMVPDLHLNAPPEMRSGSQKIAPYHHPPEPVMG